MERIQFMFDDWRRTGGDVYCPRVHGNGFIQLDLTTNTRLHFWGEPRIPRQKVATPIHNHVFDFSSQVLKGRIANLLYELATGPGANLYRQYKVYEAFGRQGSDTALRDTGERLGAYVAEAEVMSEGETYTMKSGRFHETFVSEPTVTVMTKRGPSLTQNPMGPRPQILLPINREPDNEFNRHDCNEWQMWCVILDMMQGVQL